MSQVKTKSQRIYEDYFENATRASMSEVWDNPIFEHLTIKQAKEVAKERGLHLMRFAVDYHNSMSYAEREEEKERRDDLR
jgi:O-acetylhomoserine/O-acetylserine sulfhydrylase-like pyridoxal-dependent enzyme